MHKRLSAAAAAALVALAAGTVLYVALIWSPGAAYALEQTAEANRRITSYHAKITPAQELGEVWVELKPDGTPLRARWDLQSPQDGAKVVVFADGKAAVWFKDKKAYTIVPEKDGLQKVMGVRSFFDPKMAFQELETAKASGKAQVETRLPARPGDPITLSVTPKGALGRRHVYEVDPTSKLVRRMMTYFRPASGPEQAMVVDYLDYNKPIDPKIFKPELPADVMIVDQTRRKPGLAKGDLSDEAIAAKVAREFFEALAARDYNKAGQLCSGLPTEKMKELFGDVKFYRVVEVGKPKPYAPNQSLQVPVKVEWEPKGQPKQVREFSPYVRPVYGQPDRWEICGGI